MNRRYLYIIISVILFSLLVSFVDWFLEINYFIKITFKIILFILIPLIFLLINKNELKSIKKLFIFDKNSFIKSFIIGLIIFILVMIIYYLSKNIIDYSNVVSNLNNKMSINKSNILIVVLYITFINSFLEELFFRGFGYIMLKKYISKKTAFIFSASMFSIYHLGMVNGSFNYLVILLLLVGIFIGGCIFNYLNDKNNNIYCSWIVHVFCDLPILIIGIKLFELV